MSNLAVGESPDHRRSHLLAVQARPIRPDGAALLVLGGRDNSPLSLLHNYATREAASSPPPLNLHGLLPSQGGRGTESGGECGVPALQDRLWSVPILRSGMEASHEARLAVVEDSPGRCKAAFCHNYPQRGGSEGSQSCWAHSIYGILVLFFDGLFSVPGQLGPVEHGALDNRRLEVTGGGWQYPIFRGNAAECSLGLAGLCNPAVAVLNEPVRLGQLLRTLCGQYKILRGSSSRRELNLGLG